LLKQRVPSEPSTETIEAIKSLQERQQQQAAAQAIARHEAEVTARKVALEAEVEARKTQHENAVKEKRKILKSLRQIEETKSTNAGNKQFEAEQLAKLAKEESLKQQLVDCEQLVHRLELELQLPPEQEEVADIVNDISTEIADLGINVEHVAVKSPESVDATSMGASTGGVDMEGADTEVSEIKDAQPAETTEDRIVDVDFNDRHFTNAFFTVLSSEKLPVLASALFAKAT
jgi:hypothetical protein